MLPIDLVTEVELLSGGSQSALNVALSAAVKAGKVPVGVVRASADSSAWSCLVAKPAMRHNGKTYIDAKIIAGAGTPTIRSEITSFAAGRKTVLAGAVNLEGHTNTYVMVLIER
jgi:hypothetical protein